MKRTQAGAAIVASGVAILLLLVSGLVGVAVHHGDRKGTTQVSGVGKTTTTVAGTTTTVPAAPPPALTPAGFKRVNDAVDRLSLAVPSSWRTPVLTAGQITQQLKAYASQNPQLAPLIDAALTATAKIDLGAFAADPTTRRVLYTYGVASPAGATIDDIPIPEVVKELTALGAKNIRTSQVLLPTGKADQVSLQLVVKGVTVSELVDFFILGKRVVFMVLARPGVDADIDLFKQIQQTLKPTG